MDLQQYTNYLKARNLAPDTIRSYLWGLNKYGDQEFNTSQISNFIRKGLTKYQTWSVRNQRNALASYAKFKKVMVDWEIIARVIPTIQQKFYATIGWEELDRLKAVSWKASQQVLARNNLILNFLIYTGIRVKELVNIRYSDYQNGQLKVLGKGNKVRFVLLPDFLIEYFNPRSNSYLFLTRNGNKLTETQVRMIITRKAERAGINKKITPHTFRRSFATLLHNNEAKLTTIQKLLGHSHITTTTTYIHNDYDNLRADYCKLWKNRPDILPDKVKKEAVKTESNIFRPQ